MLEIAQPNARTRLPLSRQRAVAGPGGLKMGLQQRGVVLPNRLDWGPGWGPGWGLCWGPGWGLCRRLRKRLRNRAGGRSALFGCWHTHAPTLRKRRM